MAPCSRWEGRVKGDAEEESQQGQKGMADNEGWEEPEDSGEGPSNRPPLKRRRWIPDDGDLRIEASQSEGLTDEELARMLQQQEDEAAELQRIQQRRDEEIARREQEMFNNEAGWTATPKLKRKTPQLLDELQSACQTAGENGDTQEDGPLKDDEEYAKIVQERCNMEARLQEEKRLRKLHEATGWLGDLSDRKLRERPQRVEPPKEERKAHPSGGKGASTNRADPAKKDGKKAKKDEEMCMDGPASKTVMNGKLKKNAKKKFPRACDSPKADSSTQESSPGGTDENLLGRVVFFRGKYGRIIQRMNPSKLLQEMENGLEMEWSNLKPLHMDKNGQIEGCVLPIIGLLSGLAPGVLGSLPEYKRRYPAWQWEDNVYCDRSPGELQFEYYKFGALSLQCAESAKERQALASRIAAARVEFLSLDSPYKEQLANGSQYKVEVFDTKTERGWGVRALEDIPEGRAVLEYAGELCRKDRCRRVCEDGLFHVGKEESLSLPSKDDSHEVAEKSDGSWESCEESDSPPRLSPKDYYFQLRGHRWDVDALKIGNVGRFVNHACDGFNLKAVDFLASANDIKSEMPKRIALVSTRTIFAYEELSYNYRGDGCKPNVRTQKCFCGSPSCQGFIW
ncbi:hypothetical protein GUITHDRAFT_137717 [Guillardia theta CCMP2712]|uniref:Uncharacterized protein n=1 Tax=Guillardia theta (strain CCMP2712) TaxID=905079 RepID=L1JG35_GUITC|nr:hypothetical protein GUITHDRAFT_137717 [Guillardia theta CCMP2712]EKX47109.1 hypothetical protein GUITHDRAFT_137717 [Guillardia theta CCMP2712]|eukprot:XP_005834089.1 hypothetical protein GUITHDRAFT_137717 [Guillardia theta CCMP2712]